MITKTLTMLKAEDGYVLNKGDIYTVSVLLREDETADGWTEITKEEYEAIQEKLKAENPDPLEDSLESAAGDAQ